MVARGALLTSLLAIAACGGGGGGGSSSTGGTDDGDDSTGAIDRASTDSGGAEGNGDAAEHQVEVAGKE
jgi:hypothetical protein